MIVKTMFVNRIYYSESTIIYSKVNSVDINRKTANHMKKFVLEWYEKIESMEIPLNTLSIKAG